LILECPPESDVICLHMSARLREEPMGIHIPKSVRGPKPRTPEEFAEQNRRISDWLVKQAAEEAAKKFEKEQGKK